MASPHKTIMAALNAICVQVGGVGTSTTMIAALNVWAVAVGAVGAHTTTIAALNAIAGDAGGVTTSTTDLAALNVTAVALGGSAKTTYMDALIEILGRVGGDITAPTLSAFTITATGATTANVSIVTNESGGTIYYILTTNYNEPNAEQVVAGLDGAYAAAAFAGTTGSVVAGTETGGATGLRHSTIYYGFAAHVDAAGNISGVAVAAAPTTTDP